MNGESSRSGAAPDHLFVDGNGNRLRIYVEASDVVDRPKLIRRLKKAGADLSHNPQDAQIILVSNDDRDEDDTDNLIREKARKAIISQYDRPPERVVLDVDWAWTALGKDRVALQPERWGGYHLGSETKENSRTTQGPLPTPRQTPSDTFVPVPAASSASNGVQDPRVVPPVPQQNMNSQMNTPGPWGSPYVPTVPEFFNHYLANLSPEDVAATMHDVLRHSFEQQAHGPMPNGYPLLPQYAPLQQVPNFPPDGMSGYAPPEPVIPSSLKRSSQPGNMPLAQEQQETRRSSGKRARIEDSDDEDRSESESSEEEPVRENRPKGTARQPTRIFVNDEGEALLIYLQMGIHGRSNMLEIVKRNGGRIASEISNADYVVLRPRKTDKRDFKNLLETCEETKKSAVKPDFIEDCVENCMLLDVKGYLWKSKIVAQMAILKKRGHPRKSDVIESTHREVVKQEKKSKLSTATTLKSTLAKSSPAKIARTTSTPSKASSSKTSTSTYAPSTRTDKDLKDALALSKLERRSTSTSSSPTPPTNAIEYGGGRNLFTHEERTYMTQYLPRLFNRDPEAAYTSLAKKMYEKMPQHTAISWNGMMSKQKEDIENIRKRVAIRLRKKQSAFEDIVTWFVQGKADQLQDKEVWPAIADQHSYMSQKEWEEFYKNRDGEITAEVILRRGSSE